MNLWENRHCFSLHYQVVGCTGSPLRLLFYYLFIYLIYLFLPALGLRCCMWAFSSCDGRGLLVVAVRRLLIAVASLCCGAQALGARTSVAVARGL